MRQWQGTSPRGKRLFGRPDGEEDQGKIQLRSVDRWGRKGRKGPHEFLMVESLQDLSRDEIQHLCSPVHRSRQHDPRLSRMDSNGENGGPVMGVNVLDLAGLDGGELEGLIGGGGEEAGLVVDDVSGERSQARERDINRKGRGKPKGRRERARMRMKLTQQ
jgi:hypothetical protein